MQDREGTEAIVSHAKRLFRVMYRSPHRRAEGIADGIVLAYGLHWAVEGLGRST